MPKGQFVENIKNIFQKRAQPQAAKESLVIQTAETEMETSPDPGAIAAIAAALHLSVRTEQETTSGSEVAAVIAAALHLHLSGTDSACASDKKSYESSGWSQYGREQIQNARFRVFNRPVSSDKIISV
jgi:hypothetical protein